MTGQRSAGRAAAPRDAYAKQYNGLGFERADLFELVRERFNPALVLYPGCSVHLTPAFYFPHVVFVDRDPATAAFFADRESVLEQVRRGRHYRRLPFLQFIRGDFEAPLPIRKGQFDLLLALFTPGVSKACHSYLKEGGLLLTNNHRGDALDAARDARLVLVGEIARRAGRYRLMVTGPEGLVGVAGRANRPRRYLRQGSGSLEYVEGEHYYLFKLSRARGQSRRAPTLSAA